MRWLFDCFAKNFQLLLKHLPAILLYLNIDSPTCLLFDYLIKIFHFSVKDLGKLCDDHNLTSKCWKGTFSQRFLFINANIKTLNRRLIFASKFSLSGCTHRICSTVISWNLYNIHSKTPARESLRLWHRYFPLNFAKFLFFIKHLQETASTFQQDGQN